MNRNHKTTDLLRFAMLLHTVFLRKILTFQLPTHHATLEIIILKLRPVAEISHKKKNIKKTRFVVSGVSKSPCRLIANDSHRSSKVNLIVSLSNLSFISSNLLFYIGGK